MATRPHHRAASENAWMDATCACVRPVELDDVEAVVGLVHELADYERAATECMLTGPQLEAALFCPQPALFGHVAVVGDEVVGCALWFVNFSTWRGVHGIYLEDLYVRPAHRSKGVGRALLAELACECERRGCARLEWAVLDWNDSAIGFYRALGAIPQDEWTVFRLSGEALRQLSIQGHESTADCVIAAPGVATVTFTHADEG
jgi:GNAT superfamily N-acetyltransferase